MIKKYFTWVLFVLFFIIAIVIFALSFIVDLNYEGNIKLIEIVLSSISISIGFFGTIFTFIFGLKDNNIFKIIMKRKNSKSQFKFLNTVLIFLGFAIIILCITTIVFFYIQDFDIYYYLNVAVKLIFSLLILYYLFFGTYLFIISRLIFNNEKNDLTTAKSPKIKEGVAKKKLKARNDNSTPM
ncbi:hypothetical protein [Staphylococcus pseudintermedius]|uniref:hypothetical protein n=1 Tax=Staphylococcus pseudintermedius TaxID=283734 RepID=UPI000C1C550A|nr:hypothetical protein [Staphylococcus pseudintermedius]EGQ3654710.1 hypothetical protein [Staphylococcus pseudintermedius]EIS6532753.1 hypothetical protein [Staphylococcus pseudintermedius]EJA1860498.1 hypothetical protein [Staphylococcus pseudintermedius]EJG5112649.1 hypothetical protein [Staphylococcus pseudintermedius]EJM2441745.1 hypothetical protein [Staphylococcus pseudintermedius]